VKRVSFPSSTVNVALVGDADGPDDGAPVLLLHGGGQTRHAWGSAAAALAKNGLRAVAVDLRGHGDSGWPEDGDYGLERYADDVVDLVKQLGRPTVAIGASLGGLAALLAEGERGPLLRALVLVDVAPRLEAVGVSKVLSFMHSGLDGFASLDEAADAIAKYLPHRPRPRDTAGLAKNLRQGTDGRWRWHWDPRFVRRERPDPAFGARRLQEAARRLTIPTLIVRGRQSEVLSEEGVRELRSLVPHAEYVDVAGAAHMVVGDDNDAFSAAILGFVGRLPDTSIGQ